MNNQKTGNDAQPTIQVQQIVMMRKFDDIRKQFVYWTENNGKIYEIRFPYRDKIIIKKANILEKIFMKKEYFEYTVIDYSRQEQDMQKAYLMLQAA